VRFPALPSAARVLSLLALVSGIALVAIWAWIRPLSDADRAVRAGNLEVALEGYSAAEARFDRLPLVKRLLPAAYEASVANQLWLLYRLRRYDAVLDKVSSAPPSGPAHFWAGCALYEKARTEENPDSRVSWLDRAADEFRQALEYAPDVWDAKYNYELSSRLLAQIEKQPKTPEKQLLELLRPMPTPTGQATRPVG
jgi:hypothetical protein